jgi:4-amino-4-deoxy-L-arabinose transferase-like glycosyltransferase
LATLALRLLMAFVVQFSFDPYFFAPDAEGYEIVGKQISDYWAGVGFEPQAIREGWRPGYYHLNAVFYSAFGESRLALVVLNMFAGLWTALLTFYLTREILPVASAKAAAVLTGVFPSLVLWSVINIRDALATLFTVLIVLYGMRLSKQVRLSHVWIFGAAILGLGLLRDYMAFLVVLGLGIGIVTALRTERVVPTVLFGTAVALALTYFADQVGLFTTLRPEGILETAQVLRTGLQGGATSAFGVGAETTTVGAAIQYIPVGASYLLFAPFPWDVATTLQAAAMPETLLWYPLFLCALLGFRISVKNRATLAFVPVSVLLVVVSSYALVEGNFGTAYRHRAQIMPLFFIFSGVGLSWIKVRVISQTQWWRTRARSPRA